MWCNNFLAVFAKWPRPNGQKIVWPQPNANELWPLFLAVAKCQH